MSVKDELHGLVDQLDEDAAREALACLLQAARAEARCGEGHPWAEVQFDGDTYGTSA
jgi:hypothetical protein